MRQLTPWILLHFLLITTACGRKEHPDPDVDARLQPAYARFLEAMGAAGVEVKANKISSIEVIGGAAWSQPGTVGLCYKAQDVKLKNTNIKIDKKQGKIQILDVGRIEEMEVTLIHELGHCLFEMGHSDAPDNIMFPAADYGVFPGETEALEGLLRNLGH